MKTLKRWSSIFSTASAACFVILFFQWLMTDYSMEGVIKRYALLGLAVLLFMAALILRIVKKALAEEEE